MGRMWLFTVLTGTVNPSAISRAFSTTGASEDGQRPLTEQDDGVRHHGGPSGQQLLGAWPGERERVHHADRADVLLQSLAGPSQG
jgi:hypothetical protein